MMELPDSLPENTDEQYAADELKRLLENAKQCWEVQGTKRRSIGPPYGQPPAKQQQQGQQHKPSKGAATAVKAKAGMWWAQAYVYC